MAALALGRGGAGQRPGEHQGRDHRGDESGAELLAGECPPGAVRAGWPGAKANPERVAAVWSQMAEMGVLGAAATEECGGLGLGACDLVPLLEEAERVALPLPIVETAFVAATLDGSGLVPFAGRASVPPPSWLASAARCWR